MQRVASVPQSCRRSTVVGCGPGAWGWPRARPRWAAVSWRCESCGAKQASSRGSAWRCAAVTPCAQRPTCQRVSCAASRQRGAHRRQCDSHVLSEVGAGPGPVERLADHVHNHPRIGPGRLSTRGRAGRRGRSRVASAGRPPRRAAAVGARAPARPLRRAARPRARAAPTPARIRLSRPPAVAALVAARCPPARAAAAAAAPLAAGRAAAAAGRAAPARGLGRLLVPAAGHPEAGGRGRGGGANPLPGYVRVSTGRQTKQLRPRATSHIAGRCHGWLRSI